MEMISIPVDAATARAYEASTEAERERIQFLFRLWVLRQDKRPARPLDDIMAAMAAEAAANGMTPEILESILNDEPDDE